MSIGNHPPGDGGIGNRGVVRADGRRPGDLRPVEITLGVQKWAEGSCLIRFGDTQVLCAATIEDRVPPHLRGKGTGWVTGTYEMLPRATAERSERESARGKVGGRTHEIQRLVGRSLRGVVDLARLGERTVTVDCDVLVADGGTRTASITGGYVALAAALITYGMDRHLVGHVAAVSVGIIDGVEVPGPRLHRGLARRGRLQRRRHRRGRVRRAPGHGRGQAVRPAVAGRAARPRERRARPAVRGAVGGDRHRPALMPGASSADGARRLLVATRSRHKLRELRELLDVGHEVELVSPDDVGIDGEPDETGLTFETNARIKARYYARAVRAADARRRLRAGGRRAGRRPGRVHAALRGSRRDRRGQQREAPAASSPGCRPTRRGARYVCVLALALPGEAGPRGGLRILTRRGTCRGRIATGAARDGGFGYDPIFEPASEPPGGQTLGEWSAEAKNAISHRSRAAARMSPVLRRQGF